MTIHGINRELSRIASAFARHAAIQVYLREADARDVPVRGTELWATRFRSAERFAPNCGGVEHGDTAQLTPDQITDLVAYLQSL